MMHRRYTEVLLADTSMIEPGTSTPERLEAAIVIFVQSLERGENPDRASLLSNYADVATELAEFFADHDRLNGLAGHSPGANAGSLATEMLTPGRPGSTDVTWRPLPSADVPSLGHIGHYQIL